jgi:hypothetical protein
MITPGLSQTVCAEVAAQAHFLTDGSDEFPGLATLDRISIGIGFGVEKYIILRIVINTNVCPVSVL